MKERHSTVIAGLVLLAAGPNLAAAAHYYEATTTVEGAGLGGGQSSTVRGWVDGPNARIEFEQSDASGLFTAGSYLLSNDGGETLYVVDPAERTIAAVDLAQIFQSIGAMTEATGGVVQMEFSDFTSEQLGQEPGEEILGFPTTRYRFKTGYTMSIGVLGMRRENRTESEHEFHCTDELDAEGFAVWLRPDRFRTGNEDIDRLIEQQFASVDCLPLRNRSVTTMTSGRRNASTSTTTTEVTTLREDTPPEGAFVLPTGYTETSLIPDLSAIGEAQSPEEEADAPRRRPRLRDLIGR